MFYRVASKGLMEKVTFSPRPNAEGMSQLDR